MLTRVTGPAVGVVGLGYVGLPLSIGLARAGLPVVGFDTNESVTRGLGAGQSHIQDVSAVELTQALESGARFTSDPESFRGLDTYIICVPTPLAPTGHPDLSYVEQAAHLVARMVRPGTVVVLESTTYPGTTEEVVRPILESLSGLVAGEDFCLAYSPERIDPGNSNFGIGNTPKVVGGLLPCCRDRASEVYGALGVEVVAAKGLREAELSKLLENTYRHVNIALVNEMARFCRALDIDLYDAIACAATKPFGFQAFYPGPGVGGHCIPIDPNYLSYRVRAELGYAFRFVELAQEINASMPSYVFARTQDVLNDLERSLRGSRILLLGVTYKENVADRRESPADPLAALLLAKGAEIAYSDPHVAQWSVNGTPIRRVPLGSNETFDLVILIQNHSQFEANWITSLAPMVLDTRGSLSGPGVAHL